MLCKETGIIDLGEGRIIRPGMTKAELLASPVFDQFFDSSKKAALEKPERSYFCLKPLMAYDVPIVVTIEFWDGKGDWLDRVTITHASNLLPLEEHTKELTLAAFYELKKIYDRDAGWPEKYRDIAEGPNSDIISPIYDWGDVSIGVDAREWLYAELTVSYHHGVRV